MGNMDKKDLGTKPLQARILVVEDQPLAMAVITEYLRMFNFFVMEAVNGKVAWEMLEKDPTFDLLLTDIQMPEMDGLALSHKVKNDRRFTNMPIIMQTGSVQQNDVVEGIKAGVYYYLAKPYEEEKLLAIVRSALQDRKQKQVFEKHILQDMEAMKSMTRIDFSFSTVPEAHNVAVFLGSAFRRPELAANGLYEIFLNSIEHGNLGLGLEEKSKLADDAAWQAEIDRRMELPENAGKKTIVECLRVDDKIEVTVHDQGAGFNWKPYLQIEPTRATHGNGRGIAKAHLLSFDKIEYLGNGNTVKIYGS